MPKNDKKSNRGQVDWNKTEKLSGDFTEKHFNCNRKSKLSSSAFIEPYHIHRSLLNTILAFLALIGP